MLELRQALVWNTLPHEIYCIRRNTNTNFHDAFTAKHNEDGHNEHGHNEYGHNEHEHSKGGGRTEGVQRLAQRWYRIESTIKTK